MPVNRGRSGRFKVLDALEDDGEINLRDVKDILIKRGYPDRQLDHWLASGWVKESEASINRRRGKRQYRRYFSPKEVEQIIYIAILINEVNMVGYMAAKVAAILPDREVSNGHHWIETNNTVIRIPKVRIY